MNDITTISFIVKMLRPFPFPFHIMVILLTALVWAIEMCFNQYLIKIITVRESLHNGMTLR
ncbi:hypothetical protein [Wolbachia endosymbiont (group B) of Episyrphus balteatus]|uniref:hypothetical protein n=1 Tax=Wolbachia endosymbiont (group B) of Episyrphus balteatus TaxID=2954009 RepID=UPI0022279EC7|nr:hypothetical protein [Wolbachia endosymbiont (group B) of Episyrphus balteatus]